eukprot:CAMPEP_0177768318 /NCGR_PEP_ID=MMETSP0491_2-20121128/9651_1 /TAXON_ID=63592 /ORGANISM="Tetraselmis chuii, Strain PLY429" /LENGTH=100 /DNA_ID=CAMNT_0019285105 /DNA_START=515 /DNA_END=817 /DNA_ORIENTATION=+
MNAATHRPDVKANRPDCVLKLTVAQWVPISANKLKVDNASLDIVPVARTPAKPRFGASPSSLGVLVVGSYQRARAPPSSWAPFSSETARNAPRATFLSAV